MTVRPGVDRVEAKFDDFARLFLSTHLMPSYRNDAWVVVDADELGEAIVRRLQSRSPMAVAKRTVSMFGKRGFETVLSGSVPRERFAGAGEAAWVEQAGGERTGSCVATGSRLSRIL